MSNQEDFDQVIHSELRLLDPEVRRDGDQVRKLLHPDFIEFGGSGRIWEAESIVRALALDINQHQVTPKNLQTVQSGLRKGARVGFYVSTREQDTSHRKIIRKMSKLILNQRST